MDLWHPTDVRFICSNVHAEIVELFISFSGRAMGRFRTYCLHNSMFILPQYCNSAINATLHQYLLEPHHNNMWIYIALFPCFGYGHWKNRDDWGGWDIFATDFGGAHHHCFGFDCHQNSHLLSIFMARQLRWEYRWIIFWRNWTKYRNAINRSISNS